MLLIPVSIVCLQNREILSPFLSSGFKQACFLYLMQGIVPQALSILGKKRHTSRTIPVYILENIFTDCKQIHIILSTYPDLDESKGI